MNYILPDEHLSASSINLYQMCGKKYEFKKVLKIAMPRQFQVSVGSAAHKGFEFYYKEKIKGCTTNSKTVLDYAITELEKLTKVDSAEAQLMSWVVPPYIDNVAVDVTPLEVEKEIRYWTESGVPMLGYIDLLTPGTICDYKITDKKWDLAKLQGNLQFISYCMATGIDKVSIHNVTKTSGARSKSEVKENVKDIGNIRLLDWTYDKREYQHLESIITGVAKAITAGIFVPCDPAAWNCNEKWCEYWRLCRGG